jgi:3-deoxy-D-manno-octulosonic-acid transferase
VRRLYSALVYLLCPFAFAVVLWRGVRNRLYWEGLGERFGFGAAVPEGSLWVHAVSLGEVTAAAAFIRALRLRHPRLPVILTTATPTGRARARALFGAALEVRYLPYDTPGSMRRFITRAKPRLAIIIETELWPNLFHECRRRGIPLILASARLTAKSVARYRRCGRLFRDALYGTTLVAAQSAADAERFIAAGADPRRTEVIGNVKFDLQPDPDAVERGRTLKAAWGGRPVWIAGSTHAGEEELVLSAHAELEAAAAGALLLLVPRHPQRFQAVADLLRRRGFRYERRSSSGDFGPTGLLPPEARVLLVDTVGELADLYAAVDVAFVGGSLVPVGGHTLLEPAALGIPVITGPYQTNGRETAQLLLRAGGALQVTDARQLADVLGQLFNDPARRQRLGANARRIVEANRGSALRLLELIEPFLPAGC